MWRTIGPATVHFKELPVLAERHTMTYTRRPQSLKIDWLHIREREKEGTESRAFMSSSSLNNGLPLTTTRTYSANHGLCVVQSSRHLFVLLPVRPVVHLTTWCPHGAASTGRRRQRPVEIVIVSFVVVDKWSVAPSSSSPVFCPRTVIQQPNTLVTIRVTDNEI